VNNSKETAMQLNVTGHNIEVTAALRGYVEKKLDRIARHFDQVTVC
jgi:putative sigma-54 modulation protein